MCAPTMAHVAVIEALKSGEESVIEMVEDYTTGGSSLIERRNGSRHDAQTSKNEILERFESLLDWLIS